MQKNDNIKNKIEQYDNKINESKTIIKELNKLEDDFLLLDDNFGKCLDLLNKAVKGRKASMIINESFEVRSKCINESLTTINKNKDRFYGKINEYISKKENLEKEYKQQLKDDK